MRKNTSTELPALISHENFRPGEIMLPRVTEVKPNTGIARLTCEELGRLLESLCREVHDYNITISSSTPKEMAAIFNMLQQTTNPERLKKGDIIKLYESFSTRLHNVAAIAALDDRYKGAWEKIILNMEINSSELEKLVGHMIDVETYYDSQSYSYRRLYPVEALFYPLIVTQFSTHYSRGRYAARKVDATFSLAPLTRKSLAVLLFGADMVTPTVVEALPDNKDLKIENFEQATGTDLITLAGIALTGSILSSNGSISAAAVKRIKSKSNLKEFFGRPDQWPLDRVEMLCLAYFSQLEEKGKKEITLKDFSRFVVDDLENRIGGPVFNTFMPAYLGFTKTWTSESFVYEIVSVIETILENAADGWLSLSNFRMLLLTTPFQKEDWSGFLKLFQSRDRERSHLRRRIDKEHEYDTSWKAKPVKWFEEMGFQFAVHWIRFLCAVGIVELAVTIDEKSYAEDPLEGLRYVRLTPLGKYAFGMTDSYAPPTPEDVSGVEFDGRNGIITLESANSPYVMFLSKVAIQISPIRFRISAETLLKGCRKRVELENRIMGLKTVLDPEKEPELERIIKTALSHTECAERSGGYSLLKLRPGMSKLAELITTDKELRKIAIPAAQSMVLVKTSDLEKFYTLCAANGYLME